MSGDPQREGTSRQPGLTEPAAGAKYSISHVLEDLRQHSVEEAPTTLASPVDFDLKKKEAFSAVSNKLLYSTSSILRSRYLECITFCCCL